MFRLLFKPDTLFAAVFILAIIGILDLIVINISFLDPFEKAFKDFQYTDILYSQLDQQQETVSRDIVLINIDTLDRHGIARELEIIQKLHPKVIGLDVHFDSLKNHPEDSILAARLRTIPNLVMTGTGMNEKDGLFERFLSSDPLFRSKYIG